MEFSSLQFVPSKWVFLVACFFPGEFAILYAVLVTFSFLMLSGMSIENVKGERLASGR